MYLPGMEEAVLAAAQAAKSAAMDRGYPEREKVADPGCDYHVVCLGSIIGHHRPWRCS